MHKPCLCWPWPCLRHCFSVFLHVGLLPGYPACPCLTIPNCCNTRSFLHRKFLYARISLHRKTLHLHHQFYILILRQKQNPSKPFVFALEAFYTTPNSFSTTSPLYHTSLHDNLFATKAFRTRNAFTHTRGRSLHTTPKSFSPETSLL